MDAATLGRTQYGGVVARDPADDGYYRGHRRLHPTVNSVRGPSEPTGLWRYRNSPFAVTLHAVYRLHSRACGLTRAVFTAATMSTAAGATQRRGSDEERALPRAFGGTGHHATNPQSLAKARASGRPMLNQLHHRFDRWHESGHYRI